MASRGESRGSLRTFVCGEDCSEASYDGGDLCVVVIAARLGAAAAGGGDVGSRGFVWKVAADFCDALVDAFKENGLLVFDEAREVAGRALSEKKAFTGGDLEALVHKLVMVGVREEAEINFRVPDAFAVGIAKELTVSAIDSCGSLGAESLLPDEAAVDDNGQAEFLPKASKEVRAVVVGRSDEGNTAIAVLVAPTRGRRKVDGWLVGRLNLEDVAGAMLPVLDDILVPLHDVEVEVSEAFLVEAPAGVAANAEDVVDHVADADDAHAAQFHESLGMEREQLV